jgi:hypothetical protein
VFAVIDWKDLSARSPSSLTYNRFREGNMKNRIAGVGALLLVFFLCGVSFVMGRQSVGSRKVVSHAVREMNELDRLQMETSGQK